MAPQDARLLLSRAGKATPFQGRLREEPGEFPATRRIVGGFLCSPDRVWEEGMVLGEPTAEVVSAIARGGVIYTIIRLDDLPSEPIAPASLCSLSSSDEAHELHRVVGCRGLEVTFETYGADAPLPRVGTRYALRSWWSAGQLALARDTQRQWRRERFVARDGVVFESQGGSWLRRIEGDESVGDDRRIIPGAWDHEHCSLCWATLSAYEGDEQEGYTDGNEWLCTHCFRRFIASGLGQRLGQTSSAQWPGLRS